MAERRAPALAHSQQTGADTPDQFPQVKSGDWVQPIRRGYRMKCCGCGLIHRIDFRLVKRGRGHKIQLRAFREDA